MILIGYTHTFKKHTKQLGKRYRSLQQDLIPLLEQLAQGETPGDRIVGLDDPVYKVRLKNSDNHKGKSGGYRVLYYLRADDDIRLMAMYAKSEHSQLSLDSLRRILREASE